MAAATESVGKHPCRLYNCGTSPTWNLSETWLSYEWKYAMHKPPYG